MGGFVTQTTYTGTFFWGKPGGNPSKISLFPIIWNGWNTFSAISTRQWIPCQQRRWTGFQARI